MASIEDVAQMTREDVVGRQIARAVDRIRKLEREASSAFDELLAAQESATEINVTIDVGMQPAIAAAFSEHKRGIVEAQGREIAHLDAGRRPHDGT